MSYSGDGESTLYPSVFGNEQEKSVTIERVIEVPDPLLEGLTRVRRVMTEPEDVAEFRPAELDAGFEYLPNGFRIYDAMHRIQGEQFGESQKIEIATPECLNPRELATVMRTGELMLQRGIEQYINTHRSSLTQVDAVRVQARVIDSAGNSWGCHDNYGFLPDLYKRLKGYNFDTFLINHLISRHFVTGAGHMDPDGTYHFAQKPVLTGEVQADGFNARYLTTKDDTHNGEGLVRVEVGSSDVNISDWAAQMRIGSVALLAAVVASGSGQELRKHFSVYDIDDQDDVIDASRMHNDTGCAGGNRQRQMVEFEAALARTFLEKLGADAPGQYVHLAKELLKYCQDYRDVVSGVQPLQNIGDRADWAAKLFVIKSRMARSREASEGREMGDMKSMRDDLEYDFVGVRPKHESGCFYEYGRGHKLRERGVFRDTVLAREIVRYYRTPPASRAQARGSLIEQIRASGKTIKQVGWGFVSYRHRNHRDAHVTLPYGQNAAMPAGSEKISAGSNK
ncbi:MAG: proteasome accessory factor PafA2 family protein [Candidatus Saccharimonadales bacterium]